MDEETEVLYNEMGQLEYATKSRDDMTSYEDIAKAQKGDIVRFGSYRQSYSFNDLTLQPIEWIVLSNSEDGILLLSKNIITSLPYIYEDGSTNWEKSYVREWLNELFCKKAFNTDELNMIKSNESLINDSAELRHDTVDLLSEKEIFEEGNISLLKEYYCGNWWLKLGPDEVEQALFAGYSDVFEKDIHACIGIRPVIIIKP